MNENCQCEKECKQEATVSEMKEAKKSHKGQPLVKGFRDKTVLNPMFLQQQKIDSMMKAFGQFQKDVETHLQQFQQNTFQQVQYAFQAVSKAMEDVQQISLTAEAIMNLAGLKLEDVEVEVERLKVVRAEEAEKEEDAKLHRMVVDRPSQKGDVLRIAFVGSIEGTEFPGGRHDGMNLTLGSGQFIPGFEDQLIGKKAGEVVDVVVTFPKEYTNKTLAGKTALFKTTVLKVKEVQKIETKVEETK